MSENNDNIPLDEMMRSLKKGSVQKRERKVEGGERVVRADGSEAIKVKTNKRRSVQPKKEKERKKNKRKVILITAAVGLVLLSAIAFSVALGYYNGNRFKSKVTETVVSASGAEVELGKLDVSPATAELSKIVMKWPAENTVLKQLTLKGIDTDYGVLAFIGGGWGGSNVGIKRADLDIEMVEKISHLKINAERPIDFKFELYECSELNVDFGEDSLWDFTKGSVSYRVAEDSDGQFSINGGEFTVPLFGEFTVRNGLVSCESDKAQVYLGLMAKDEIGAINLDGAIGYTKGSSVNLETELQNYSLRDWMDPRARRFVNGRIRAGEGTFKMKLGNIDSFEITTKLTSREIGVKDFEFVDTITQYLEGEHNFKFEFAGESKMTMSWIKHKIEFSDIDFQQDGQLRIKGGFAIGESNQMTGSLKIGIPVAAVSTKKGKILKEVFSDDDGEYIWADVTISGKASSPQDNLDEMLKEAKLKSASKAELFDHFTQ